MSVHEKCFCRFPKLPSLHFTCRPVKWLRNKADTGYKTHLSRVFEKALRKKIGVTDGQMAVWTTNRLNVGTGEIWDKMTFFFWLPQIPYKPVSRTLNYFQVPRIALKLSKNPPDEPKNCYNIWFSTVFRSLRINTCKKHLFSCISSYTVTNIKYLNKMKCIMNTCCNNIDLELAKNGQN